MSATADRIEELRTREAELDAEIAERDSLDERRRAAEQNREQLEADLDGDRKAARIAYAQAAVAAEAATPSPSA